MAYNPYFRNPYQANYEPYQQGSSLLWVQGMEGAKAWSVMPGSAVILLDSESPVFYIKSTDATGMPSLKVFEYKEKSTTQQDSNLIIQSEIDEIKKRIDAIEKGAADHGEPAV